MERDLKEYEAHILDSHADNQGKAWCGASIATATQFVFQNVDHAAMNGRNKGRLIPCPKCRQAVIAGLMNGAED